MDAASQGERRAPNLVRLAWWAAGLAVLAGLVLLMATARTGPVDPTDAGRHQSHVLLGLAGTAVVGVLTFWLHHRLPYKRMLVLTGVLVGMVLVVMIGGTALTFQDLGWLPRHATPFTLPVWMGSWFEMYSTYETLAVQLLAAVFVVGSYRLAKEVRVKRPQRRGIAVATRAEAPPAPSSAPSPAR
jgi:xanthine/uracil permease